LKMSLAIIKSFSSTSSMPSALFGTIVYLNIKCI